jgi:hypothetical protein
MTITTSVTNNGPSTAHNIEVRMSSKASHGIAPPLYTSTVVVGDSHFAVWHIDELRVGETISIDTLYGVLASAQPGGLAQLETRIVDADEAIDHTATVGAKRVVFLVRQHD